MRALTADLIDWVTKGTEPPPSRYPRLDRGELVPAKQSAMKFPSIPGVPAPEALVNPVYDYDFGPDFRYGDESGVITKQPPSVRQILPTLVPKVDADGNDMAGVPSVLRQAPLGTYLGWNITAAGFHKGQICNYAGGMIPFARNKAERAANEDPRPSLEERYRDHAGYVAAVTAAARNAVAAGFLLENDAKSLIAAADASNVLK